MNSDNKQWKRTIIMNNNNENWDWIMIMIMSSKKLGNSRNENGFQCKGDNSNFGLTAYCNYWKYACSQSLYCVRAVTVIFYTNDLPVRFDGMVTIHICTMFYQQQATVRVTHHFQPAIALNSIEIFESQQLLGMWDVLIKHTVQ